MTNPTGGDVATTGPAVRQRPDKKASGRYGTRRALTNMNRWFRPGRRARSDASGPVAATITPPGEHSLQFPTHGGGLYPEAGGRRDYYPDE